MTSARICYTISDPRLLPDGKPNYKGGMRYQLHVKVLMACGTCGQMWWMCRLCGQRLKVTMEDYPAALPPPKQKD